MMRLRWSAVALLLCVLGSTNLDGQVVRGTVLEEESRRRVAGALVQLLAANDSVRASAVTGENARFALPQVSPGTYRLRMLRIGFRAWTSEPITLAAGQVIDDTIAIPAVPVVLEEITVEANSPCRGSPEEDRRMALLWDEARKSLRLSGASSGELLTFRTERSRWFVDPYAHVSDEHRWEAVDEGRWPITSLAPESLAVAGFVQPQDTTLGPIYYGPDAAVFFSDGFLRTHCFRLVAPPAGSPGMLGLGFEPVKGRPVPDIEGVLWLDRKTSALDRLEYRYTGLWSWVPAGRAGGSVEFALLSSGHLVLTGWELRAPMASTQPYAPTDRRRDESTRPFFGGRKVLLHGFKIEVGSVQEVLGADRRVLWSRDAAGG
jgi:hypothetical protein